MHLTVIHILVLFLPLTSRQSRNFVTKVIPQWLGKKGWNNNYPEYNNLFHCDQKEIHVSFNKASSRLILRVWEEVSNISIVFLTKNSSSPYQNVKAVFPESVINQIM